MHKSKAQLWMLSQQSPKGKLCHTRTLCSAQMTPNNQHPSKTSKMPPRQPTYLHQWQGRSQWKIAMEKLNLGHTTLYTMNHFSVSCFNYPQLLCQSRLLGCQNTLRLWEVKWFVSVFCTGSTVVLDRLPCLDSKANTFALLKERRRKRDQQGYQVSSPQDPMKGDS